MPDVLAGWNVSQIFYPGIDDWETAYSNRRAISDASSWLSRATEKSAGFLQEFNGAVRLGIPYGDSPRHVIDVFEPAAPATGTVIFVHGGYWRATGTGDHHHFAKGPIARGWRVVMIEYPLCPSVSISQIAGGIVTAIEKLVNLYPSGPMILSGHSAGGHLVTFAASHRSGLSPNARSRLSRVVSLSGLHDLRPLLKAHELNQDLRLTEEEAVRMSPALDMPGHDFDLYCICGGGELEEFKRQTVLLAAMWGGSVRTTHTAFIGELNHFRLLDELTSEGSELTRCLTNG